MPNIIAYVAIYIWPLITFYLIRRYGVANGCLLSLMGGYMFLPAGLSINLPGIPAFDKFTITTMSFIALFFLMGKKIGFANLPKTMKLVFIAFVISPLFTALANNHSYLFLPGLKVYDGLSDSASNFLTILPLLIGLRYFSSYERQLTMFKYFVIAGVIYGLLTLYEVRMSPQLHRQLYGYFPHSWLQQVREGGFRSIVFMGHGLLVAMFLAVCIGFTATMHQLKMKVLPIATGLIVIGMLIALIFQKSSASLIYGAFLLVMIMFFSNKRIHQVSLLIAVLYLTYPILSATNLFPHKFLVELAESFSPERAQSLEYRFENEKLLLQHADTKPIFGWGGWGRNRVYDIETGKDISTTDGKWILTLGIRGWFGFFAEAFFITVPLWLAFNLQRKSDFLTRKQAKLLSSHALVVAVILLDQMPNASMNPLYWLLVGSLLGRVLYIKNQLKANNVKFPGEMDS